MENKNDKGKLQLTLVPSSLVEEVAKVREYGINKYPNGGSENWKTVEPERYLNALYRHLLEEVKTPNGIDEESKLPHLSHIACNVAFLIELRKGK